MKTAKIYVKQFNTQSINALRFLKQHEVTFDQQDVGEIGLNDAVKAELISQFGTVPDVSFKIDDDYINGFDEATLSAALEIEE